MTLLQIEQVIEIANVGSITQAAINLYISQPNLSLSVKKFEHEIGIKIFERTSTGVKLTQFGKEFVERAQDIMLQVGALEGMCKKSPGDLPLELSIASVGYRILEIKVADVIKKHNKNVLNVNLISAVGTKLLDMVAEECAEIGMCTVYEFTKKNMMQQITIRNLEYHRLGLVKAGIYVGKENKRFSNLDTLVDFNKFHDMPMVIIAKREFNAKTVVDYLFNEKNVKLDCSNIIEVSNFGTLRTVVSLTDAFAIAAYLDVSYERGGYYNDLRFIPFDDGILSAEVGLVQKNNAVRSVLVNEVVNALQKSFIFNNV